MKLLKQTLFLMVAATSVCASAYKKDPVFLDARRNGGMTQIILHVRDDLGEPIVGTEVKVRMGMTFAEKSYDINGRTDTGGVFVINGKTTGNEIGMSLSKPGYYDSTCKLCYIKMGEENDVKDGKWQPYPMEKTVILKKIRNPTALCTICNLFRFPATNIWFRFDMRVGDFVKPFGKGETADFECQVEWDGLPPTKSTCCKMSLRMLDRLAGGYYAYCTKESEYPFSYAANVDAELIKELNVVNRDGNPHTTKVPFREGCEFVTRTRCKVDNDGRLVAANYGSIRALSVSPSWDGNPTLRLYSVINQTPNDTNLEDDALYQQYKRFRGR